MANTIGWGQGSVNNTIGWGKAPTNNTIGYGSVESWSPETNLTGSSETPYVNEYSFNFDGVDDYVETSTTYSELDGQNNFTFSFWVKPTNLNNTTVVFSIGNGNADYRAQQFYVYITTTGQIFFYLGTMSFSCRSNNSAISSNQWHHVLICRDHNEAIGSKAKIFVNSVDVTNNDSTRYWSNTNATTSLYIGEHTNVYLNPFLGNIDEFAIYSGTDLRNNVATIYNNGVPNNLNDNGLTVPTTWYRMGENSTWNGREWNPIQDVQGSNNALGINMAEENRQADVPT